MKSEISGLSESLKKSTSGLSDPSISKIEESALFQNSPNPFNDATDIKYYIPLNSNMSSINIYDLNGKMLDSYEIKSEGVGKITIPGSLLDAGMYLYNLIVDGKIIDTKQMILTK